MASNITPNPMNTQYTPEQQKHNRRTLYIALGAFGGALVLCCVIAGIAGAVSNAAGGSHANATATISHQQSQQVFHKATATSKPTAGPAATPKPTPKPTANPTPTPHVVHYPPTTQADLLGLAAKGDAGAIHEFHSESVGLGVCPQPKREILVDPNLTGQQLAEDLLAYFYGQQLTSPCGSLVLAYHSQSEAGDVYTAGRIILDVTDSSGAVNIDPNATDLKYTLTLDIGGVLSGQQEYIVTY